MQRGKEEQVMDKETQEESYGFAISKSLSRTGRSFAKACGRVVDAVLRRICQIESPGICSHSNRHTIFGESIGDKPGQSRFLFNYLRLLDT